MIIFGVDPGSRKTGYGVISAQANHFSCLGYGGIVAATRRPTPLPQRLKTIYGELKVLLRQHVPAAVVVEEVFHAVNVQTALKLGQARGVVLLAAAEMGVPLFEYSPLEVKKAVVGYGRAEKSQVQLMVQVLLKLKKPPEPHDAADALAIALCHAFNGSPAQRSRRPGSSLR
ncbi:MAG: crossover junction endodeoxyribonuclease RuvC [Acidobacteriota bacterium]